MTWSIEPVMKGARKGTGISLGEEKMMNVDDEGKIEVVIIRAGGGEGLSGECYCQLPL